MLSRRSLLGAMLAAATPPAFVRYGSLMAPAPVKIVVEPWPQFEWCQYDELETLMKKRMAEYFAEKSDELAFNHLMRGELGEWRGITIIKS
jgi:hypothetical protein